MPSSPKLIVTSGEGAGYDCLGDDTARKIYQPVWIDVSESLLLDKYP